MISTLHIKNIGIIDEITFDLSEGFNVLTGETGAGKTLIVDSILLVSGGRFSKDMIRQGENYCLVEACLFLPNTDMAEDSNVIVSREIHLNGKNLCKINGRLVTVNELKIFMTNYIDVHGQNDNQKVMDASTHIEYLDRFCRDIDNKKSEYQKLYLEYKDLKSKLNEEYLDDKEKERMLDLYNYELREIDDANLRIGEDEEIESSIKKIQNCERIKNSLECTNTLLSSEVLNSMDEALKMLSKIEQFDLKYCEKYTQLKNVYYEAEEIARDIDNLNSNLEFDAEKSNEVLRRFELISDLKRKYGNTIEEILNYRETIANKLQSIINMEEYVQSIREKKEKIEKVLFEKAQEMGNIRKKSALLLEAKINKELKELEMKDAMFKVKIEDNLKLKPDGINDVEFLVSTNKKEEFKPLIKIASGGEISRIMLSIKSIISEKDGLKTAIFDEVDTGISGSASKAVGEKLSKIASKSQIICVTHSSIIAAAASSHFFVSKASGKDSRVRAEIGLLDMSQSIREIARISSGVINDMTIGYAKELKRQFINV